VRCHVRPWLAGLYPRRSDLAELASRILDLIDHQGYLKVWGWHGQVDCSQFSKSACWSAMHRLVELGYVEIRVLRFGKGGSSIDAYVRSDRYRRFEEQDAELENYGRTHRWWEPTGNLVVPQSGSPRKLLQTGFGKLGRVENQPGPFGKGDRPSSDSSDFRDADTPGTRVEKGEVFALLAERLGVSVERSRAVAEEWGKEWDMPAEAAAKAYLEG